MAIAGRPRRLINPGPNFKNQIMAAFAKGRKERPATAFRNAKADVLADFVEIIRRSPWTK